MENGRLGPAERHQRRLKLERLQALALDAVQRRQSALPYVRRDVALKGEDGEIAWRPTRHYCHDNVDTWVHHSPADSRVRGFVLFGPVFGMWRVAAHSLVRMADGTLADITPHEASQLYPFVPHTGSDLEFEEFASEIQIDVHRPDHS